MKHLLPGLFLLLVFSLEAQQNFPVYNSINEKNSESDWLVKPVTEKAAVYKSVDEKDIILYNGLVKRIFRLQPNLVCTDYKNMSNGQQLSRAVKPEAQVTIDGTAYNIGGLYGQTENAYLQPEWLNSFVAHDSDFHFVSFEVTDLNPFLNRKTKAWMPNSDQPKGKDVAFNFTSSLASLKDIVVKVHYELYDGIPLIVKWVSVENKSDHVITIGKLVNEQLALVEEESAVVGTPEQMKKQHGMLPLSDNSEPMKKLSFRF